MFEGKPVAAHFEGKPVH